MLPLNFLFIKMQERERDVVTLFTPLKEQTVFFPRLIPFISTFALELPKSSPNFLYLSSWIALAHSDSWSPRMHRAARAGGRRESKQPLIGSRYALLLRSGVGAPTGLSSVVPNAAARRFVVATTVAAAALAPSREILHVGPPDRQYRFGTARSCSCSCTTANDIPLIRDRTSVFNCETKRATNSAASSAVKSVPKSARALGPFFLRVSEPRRSSKCIPIRRDREGPSTLGVSPVEERKSKSSVRKEPPVYVARWRREDDLTARKVQEAWFITNRRRRDSASLSGSACSRLTIGRLIINRTVTAARAVSAASVPRRRA